MAIPEKDIKKLWGRAAGRCSKPGCGEECVKYLDAADPTVIGEMAHIIAAKPAGPRGVPSGGEDTYGNTILLCPTHHTEIDKAPDGVFTVDLLHEWKSSHEKAVSESFRSPVFKTSLELAVAIKRILEQNKVIWEQYGPESKEAIRNPLSNMQSLWELRKLDSLVPNNQTISNMLQRNPELIDVGDQRFCAQFIEHANGFEHNCYERTEGVPQFPSDFARMIDRYADIE